MRSHRLSALVGVLLVALAVLALSPMTPARADTFVPISGAGSTWSSNALEQWIRNVKQYGMTVNFAATGSSDGRNQFRNGTVDFGVSEIPYGIKDSGVIDPPPSRGYAYMPIVAGGTSFMYNLKIGRTQVTNLRLSGPVIAKIFTGVITNWADPAIAADNPGLTLPRRQIIPVVRSDGSGTTAQFSTWMASVYPSIWNAYCVKVGRPLPCGTTSQFPVLAGSAMTSQNGSTGVAGYVSQGQSDGAITYVEYSYALNTGFPVAKVLNDAQYYTEPTAQNVAVGLLGAKINNDPTSPNYLTQDLTGVYHNADPRTYPLSSYSYMIIPTKVEGTFTPDKGRTLGAFAYYFLCQGQQQAPVLGYSPLPINLVQAGLSQVRRIPGVDVQSIDISKCNNPTFSSSGANTLALTAPQPSPCDKLGVTQCSTGTGGDKQQSTPVKASARGANGGTSVPAATGGSTAPTTGAVAPGAVPGHVGSRTTTTTTAAAGNASAAQTVNADGTVSDPTANGAGGPTQLIAQPVSLSAAQGTGVQHVLMGVSALVLLLVMLVPPLLMRRLRRGRS